jgi:putative membrane protein
MRRFISYFACMALVFSFSLAFAQENNGANTQRSEKTQTTKQTNFDKNFIKDAAQANMAEIQLAQLAQQKASDPQVKQLAQTIEQDHTQAQSKLEQVAQSNNVSMPTAVPQKDQNEQQKLSSMSGKQFDHAYTQMMIRDHKTDIKKFKTAEKMASDTGVCEYASSTLPDLQKHLNMAEKAAGQAPSTQASE